MGLKDIFALIGGVTTVGFAVIVIFYGMYSLLNYISEYKDQKKYEYNIKHRFDNPPLAKCYCVDCVYCQGVPNEHGYGVYCSLLKGAISITDDCFCCRAYPKPKPDKEEEKIRWE